MSARQPLGPPALYGLKDTHAIQVKVIVVHGGCLSAITATIKTVQL
jgi:hypothetical protein